MTAYDFSAFANVEITGVDLSTLTEEQLSVLYQAARYCEAMTEADIDTMRAIVSEDPGGILCGCGGREPALLYHRHGKTSR